MVFSCLFLFICCHSSATPSIAIFSYKYYFFISGKNANCLLFGSHISNAHQPAAAAADQIFLVIYSIFSPLEYSKSYLTLYLLRLRLFILRATNQFLFCLFLVYRFSLNSIINKQQKIRHCGFQIFFTNMQSQYLFMAAEKNKYNNLRGFAMITFWERLFFGRDFRT